MDFPLLTFFLWYPGMDLLKVTDLSDIISLLVAK